MFKMYSTGMYPMAEKQVKEMEKCIILKELLVLCTGY